MNKQARMIRGEVMSWAMGILLGLMLGIGLLIFANSTAPNPKNDAAKDGAAQTTTAESAATAAEAGNTAKTAGHTDGTGNAATSTSESKEGAPTVADPATTAGGPEASEASTEPATSEAVTSEAATAEASASAAATEAAASTGGAGAASGDPAAGKTVFAGTCGGCHGAQAQGAVGPSLTTEASSWDLAGFKGAVREGKTPDGRTLAPMMPHFSEGQLSDSDLTNIHAWLQSL